jgi:hypothetical protein
MNSTYQASANNIAEGKWHCFDIPFTLVCGGMPLAKKIYNHLRQHSNEFREQFLIALA